MVEILNRSRMMECMNTPMASNLKLLSVASSELVDVMISSDDLFIDVSDGYLTRYLPCCEHIETCSLDGCKYDTN